MTQVTPLSGTPGVWPDVSCAIIGPVRVQMPPDVGQHLGPRERTTPSGTDDSEQVGVSRRGRRAALLAWAAHRARDHFAGDSEER